MKMIRWGGRERVELDASRLGEVGEKIRDSTGRGEEKYGGRRGRHESSWWLLEWTATGRKRANT